MHSVSRTTNVDQGPAATKDPRHTLNYADPISSLSILTSVPLDSKGDFPSPV